MHDRSVARQRSERGPRRGAPHAALARRIGFDETGRGQARARRHRSSRPTSSSMARAAKLLVWRRCRRRRAWASKCSRSTAGPGMANVAACLRDGYSTAGSAGQRPGRDVAACPLRRHRFAARASGPRAGPVVPEMLAASGRPPAPGHSGWRRLRRPSPGEGVAATPGPSPPSGDGRTCCWSPTAWATGPAAAEASAAAVRLFDRTAATPAPNQHATASMRGLRAHARRRRRGRDAATPHENIGVFAGVGNIGGVHHRRQAEPERAWCRTTARLGINARKVQSVRVPVPPRRAAGPALGRALDELALDRYPGLPAPHPTLIAAVLYRDSPPRPRRRDRAGRPR